jgi:2-oxoglutarate dehydrogenase E2 component (dihydrolipoamide succinyltransferase)
MATELRLERLSDEMEYATILRWLHAEGEPVTAGEVIVEVEAEKVTVELLAPATGILTSILAVQGDEVKVDQVIAVISESDA